MVNATACSKCRPDLNLTIGQLKIGDQLLQANDESLVGISNERYVGFNAECTTYELCFSELLKY